MSTPTTHWPRIKLSSRLGRLRWRGLVTLAVLAAAPKCLLCLSAWLGLGTLLGVGGPEICGVTNDPLFAQTPAGAMLLVTASAIGLVLIKSRAGRQKSKRSNRAPAATPTPTT